MKKLLFFVTSLILLASCTQTKKQGEEPTPAPNRINRDGGIAFMGLRLGLSNDSVKTVLQASENLIVKDFPDFYRRDSQSIFDGWDEKEVGSFFCTVIDANNESHGGWGRVKSDVDSITTIYFYIPSEEETDSIFERLKPLFIERYGDPDEEYDFGQFDQIHDIVGNTAFLKEEAQTTLYDRGCYWDFANDQRIYLDKKLYLGTRHRGLFGDHEHIEIVYRDMKVVKRIEEAKILKEQQTEQANKKAEEERVKNNTKLREEQQL